MSSTALLELARRRTDALGRRVDAAVVDLAEVADTGRVADVGPAQRRLVTALAVHDAELTRLAELEVDELLNAVDA